MRPPRLPRWLLRFLNSRKGISIYRRGATLLARKMQPDHLEELVERLYDLRDTARIIPLAQVEIGDGSARRLEPFSQILSRQCQCLGKALSYRYKAVRGYLGLSSTFPGILRFELGSFGSPHFYSVIEALRWHAVGYYPAVAGGSHPAGQPAFEPQLRSLRLLLINFNLSL